MTYATTADMQTRFGEQEVRQLSDEYGSGAINTDVLQAALDDAHGIIDSYLAPRYDLPLTAGEIPTILISACADIARFMLYQDRAPETVQARRDAWIRWLADVRDGKNELGIQPTSGAEHPGTAIAAADGPDQVFTSTLFSGWPK